MKWVLRASLVLLIGLSAGAQPCLGQWGPLGAVGPVAQQCLSGQCSNGQCSPAQSRGLSAGLSVGGWRSVTPRASRPVVPVANASSVVPVLFGSDPTPAAGVYVGVLGGQGVTLTCWHAAKYGVASVAAEQPTGVTRDKYGYDMAAVFTRPLNVPVARLGQPPRPGVAVTITGFPAGRFGSHAGRVLGYFDPDPGQPWGDLKINVASLVGDSGGGVWQDGLLVGLLWGNRSGSTPGTVAVSVPAIADFLRRLRLRHEAQIIPIPEIWDGLVPCDPPPEYEPAELAELRAEVAELRALIAAIERGSQGEPGAVGATGSRGQDGADGSDGTSPTIDYAAVAAEVIPLIDPIIVRTLDDSGIEVDREEIRPGDVLNFHHRVLSP